MKTLLKRFFKKKSTTNFKIHLYTICKDEEILLPFFLQHYDQIADEIVILFDKSTTDTSEKIIDDHPKCRKVYFDFGGKVRDDFLTLAKNSIWKESCNKADWVVVVDIDEFLYHKKGLRNYLMDCMRKEITIPLIDGFDMFSDFLPVYGKPITLQIRDGKSNIAFCKKAVFNPNKISDIHYLPGAHQCEPEGIVTYSKEKEIKLLHYKYIGGLERMKERWITYGNNLSELNIVNGWGIKRKDSQEIVSRYYTLKETAKKII